MLERGQPIVKRKPLNGGQQAPPKANTKPQPAPPAQDGEDRTIKEWAEQGKTVEVRLVNNSALSGKMRRIRKYSLVLDTPEGPVVINKGSMITVHPVTNDRKGDDAMSKLCSNE